MATNQLALYNIACAAVGEMALNSTADNREISRELDKVWDRGDGATKYLLEQGLWNFATSRAAPTVSTSTGAFGHAFSFALPSDFVRMVNISTRTDMADPLLIYEIEGTRILAGSSVVYIRYISNSTAGFGGDLGNWPETFTLWAGHWLATQVYNTVAKPTVKRDDLQTRTDMLLTNARLKNVAEWPKEWPKRDVHPRDERALDQAVELVVKRRQD